MTTKITDIIDVEILDVAYRGKGVARHEGCVLFIPGVIKGEKVRVRVTEKKKNYLEAELVEVLEAASSRVKPVCSHAYIAGKPADKTCPGCCYQHIDYGAELQIKQEQFISQLSRFAHMDVACCLPPTGSGARMGYRNKVVLHADNRNLGYFSGDNTTLIDIARCPLAMSDLNRLLKAVRTDDDFAQHLTEHEKLTLRSTGKNGCLYWWDETAPEADWISETTRIGKIRFHQDSFFQINPDVADKLLVAVMEIYKQIEVTWAIDLYCGVGIFSIAARLVGINKVSGIDLDKKAIKAARTNALERNLNGIKFIHGKTSLMLKERFPRVKGRETVLLVDPPRKGLDKETRHWILSRHPKHLIYISCAVDTLARDLAELKKAGYHAKQAQLFDMFPRTPYFESLVWLQL